MVLGPCLALPIGICQNGNSLWPLFAANDGENVEKSHLRCEAMLQLQTEPNHHADGYAVIPVTGGQINCAQVSGV